VASAVMPHVAAALALNIDTVRLSHCVVPTPPVARRLSRRQRAKRALSTHSYELYGAVSIATSIYLGFGPTNVSVNGALKRHHFFPKKNRGREFI
jgi:hypothetical protein